VLHDVDDVLGPEGGRPGRSWPGGSAPTTVRTWVSSGELLRLALWGLVPPPSDRLRLSVEPGRSGRGGDGVVLHRSAGWTGTSAGWTASRSRRRSGPWWTRGVRRAMSVGDADRYAGRLPAGDPIDLRRPTRAVREARSAL